jgi:hypothetical protein
MCLSHSRLGAYLRVEQRKVLYPGRIRLDYITLGLMCLVVEDTLNLLLKRGNFTKKKFLRDDPVTKYIIIEYLKIHFLMRLLVKIGATTYDRFAKHRVSKNY